MLLATRDGRGSRPAATRFGEQIGEARRGLGEFALVNLSN